MLTSLCYFVQLGVNPVLWAGNKLHLCVPPEYWSSWSAAFRLSNCVLTSKTGLAAALNFMWSDFSTTWSRLPLMQDTPQTLLGVKSYPSLTGDCKKGAAKGSDAYCLPPVQIRRTVRPQWWPWFSGYVQEPRKRHDFRLSEIIARKSRKSLSAMINKNFCIKSDHHVVSIPPTISWDTASSLIIYRMTVKVIS